ncbi:hypothetical protein [Enhydrobacter aerosaccus]|nr:hypothetical protein [Enhydrobacter aerosaccus]
MTGRDAATGADAVLARLEAARQDTLDQAGNAAQHRLLQQALADHRLVEQATVANHVGRQTQAWRQATAQARLDQLRRQATIDHADPGAIESLHAAADGALQEIARTRPQTGAAFRDPGTEPSIWRVAIDAALGKFDYPSSIVLYNRAADRIDPAERAILQPLIEGARQHLAGQDYLKRIGLPDTQDLAALDAAHQAATAQNEADWPDNASQRATNQHYLDVAFGRQKLQVVQAKGDLVQAVTNWLDQPAPDGGPQTQRPPLPLWTKLNQDEQRAVDDQLARNANAQALHPDSPPPNESAPPDGSIDPEEPLPRQDPGVTTAETNSGAPTGSSQKDSRAESATVPAAAATAPATVAPAEGPPLADLAATVARQIVTLAPDLAAPAAFAISLLTPMNSTDVGFELDDGLRVRLPPGQRTATIERRTHKGILGIGETWQPLPVEAAIGETGTGHQALLINRDQLERAVGPEAAKRALAKGGVAPNPQVPPPPVPWIVEIHVAELDKDTKTIVHRDVPEERVRDYCPNYPMINQAALEGSARAQAKGLPNGMAYGRSVHKEVQTEVEKMAELRGALDERGIKELRAEQALLRGEPLSHTPPGSSRLDVLELYPDRRTACVYEIKTGNARLSKEALERYAREAQAYAKAGYDRIYVVVVRVP